MKPDPEVERTHTLATQLVDTPFDKMYKEVRRAKYYVSRITGEHLSLTAEKKLLWALMLDRFLFFKSNGGAWFDNQQWLADECGVSVITVKRFMKELREHGYLLVTTTRVYGGQSNSYEITANLQVVDASASETLKAIDVVPVTLPELSPVAANDDDDDIFGAVVGTYGSTVKDEPSTDCMQDDQWADYDDRVYDSVDVSTTSKGAAPSNAPARFLVGQPSTSSAHDTDYDTREYGYTSEECPW